jgi:hypothetical protein
MLPEEWPIAALTADQNAPARPAGSDRLTTVRVDFFLPGSQRLTEQERALMTAMLHCLVGDIADEIRAFLPSGWAAANDESNLALIEALVSARLLDQRDLMALLLRRADEERIATGAKARSGRRDARMLQGLVSHDNGPVSAAAMALILARGRRRDRFGQCLVAFDDLTPETAGALVHLIAAAMRANLVATRSAAEVDAELGTTCTRVIAAQDPERGIDALTAGLMRLLDEAGALSDDLLLAAAHEGETAFVAEALALRGSLTGTTAIDELLSGTSKRVVTLFRIAGLKRDTAAGLLAGFGDLLGIDDSGAAIGQFDALGDHEVAAARSWLASASAYRSAASLLDDRRG